MRERERDTEVHVCVCVLCVQCIVRVYIVCTITSYYTLLMVIK